MMQEPPAHQNSSTIHDQPVTAFDGLLAEGTAVAELLAPDFCTSGDLLPEEERFVARAMEKRRREFIAGRSCARLALRRLGAASAAIGVGSFREPLFPAGISGSITHTREYCAAAVVRTGPVLSIGIDAEFNQPLDRSVADLVLTPDELRAIDAFKDGCYADALVFSIKEAFFKAVFPFLRQYLKFSDVSAALSAVDCSFHASLRRPT
jgi:4'-phosphopantetheinyl transferase EntD